jgi:hypothetical protein
MPRWVPRLLKRIHELAGRGRVRLTLKAARELAAIGAGLDVQDVCEVLAALAAEDFAERLESEHTALKLILRADCVVVSFHEDEGETDEDRS